ncbi:hypothetical protein J2X36_003942 [Methylobacterium sp. BE186]|uniref:hypothetical protein n=1 Tax=Methylobacterium sp. BE186 TaxID=2817715 RepID=UPI00285AEF73|nr:hypothetical protein [Methylobacterium sp. BE186]MDR7039169.1 hypothetical protein [Methylobacterium sp. BE186]
MSGEEKKIFYIIERTFPRFSKEIRDALDGAMSENKGHPDTSDLIVKETWQRIKWPLESDGQEWGSPKNPPSKAMLEQLRQVIEEGQSLEEALWRKSADDLHAAYHEIKSRDLTAENIRRSQRAAELDLNRFFNEPEATADFAKWASLATWTVAEAAALSFGKCPNIVNLESLSAIGSRSLFVGAFKQRLQQLSRALEAGDIKSPNRPQQFFNWFVANEIEIPQRMNDVIQQNSKRLINYRSLYEQSCARASELEQRVLKLEASTTGNDADVFDRKKTSYRIVLGLAIAVFGYRTDQRNKAAAEIEDALRYIGEPVDVKVGTIRDFLKDAANALEFNWLVPEDSLWADKRVPRRR